MRRVLFAVIVAVLGCMGAWFMVTTVSAGNTSRSMLTATDDASELSTIMLLSFRNGAAERRAATLLAGKPEIQALAGPNEFELMDLPAGRCALCVGRFEGEASPELTRLLKEFADYAAEGVRPFNQAAIMPIAR